MRSTSERAPATPRSRWPPTSRTSSPRISRRQCSRDARLAKERNLSNVEIRDGDAEALPFPDESFDLVTCRLAFHHFPHPDTAVREFARVLRPGGILGFADNIAVEDREGAAFYNAYEKLRDPSHHEVLPLSRLITLFETAGLHVEATRSFSKEFLFEPWADRMHVSTPDKAKLIEMLRTCPQGARPCSPRVEDAAAHFSLWESVISAPTCSAATRRAQRVAGAGAPAERL
jgi:SAM-dependent methyltransferase